MKFKLVEQLENIPKYLYHATYKPFLKSILEKGLGNTNKKMWTDSKGKGVVYLANNPDVAESYAEESEWVDDRDDPDKYYDNIIILIIDTNKLDKSVLYIDKNVLLDDDEENATYEYNGIIDKDAILSIKTSSQITKDDYNYNAEGNIL